MHLFLPDEMPPLYALYIYLMAFVSPYYNHLFSSVSSLLDGELTEDETTSSSSVFLEQSNHR